MRYRLVPFGLLAASLAAALGCLAPLRGDRTSVSVVSSHAATFQGGYAAMDEVPVVGGELRLIAPQVIDVSAFHDPGDPGGPAMRPDGVAAGPSPGGARHGEVIAFPLRHTAVRAKVAGAVGVYEIEQEFANPFPTPIEAVYVFPLGDDAAISGYRIAIGDRVIEGKIQTRADARRTYESARAAGHTAALVEQQKPNVFLQHVANIAPHETVRVTLTYTELLDYQDGTYELAVPLTIGPRYLPVDRAGQTPVSARAHGDAPDGQSLAVPYADPTIAASTVSFTADIDAGVPIGELKSPSHGLTISSPSATTRRVTLARADELPNRDLVLHYATASNATMAGVLTHRVTDDGYFLLNVQPKASYRTGDVTSREVVLVLDTSGSMSGQPLAQAKSIGSAIVQSLSARDTFNVLQFASGVAAMSPAPIPGDRAGQARGLAYLTGLHADGGTAMDAGVAAMLAEEPGPEQVRIIYFLTDGYVGNDDVVIGAARRLAKANRIMTIGIGSAPNRYLLDRIASAGRGFSTYVALNEAVAPVAKDLVLRSAYPYLTDVTVDWGELEVGEISPSPIPDVYAGQPLVLSGRYRKPGAGTVKIRARSGGRAVEIPVAVTLPERRDAAPVAQLWARRKIEALMREVDPEVGMSDRVREQLVELGLAFSLVTQETSFVAVDRARVVEGGQARTIEQPALVPEGSFGESVAPPPAPAPTYAQSSSSYTDNDSGWGGWGAGATPRGVRWSALALALGALGALLARRRRRS